jgi:hypothetical protein
MEAFLRSTVRLQVCGIDLNGIARIAHIGELADHKLEQPSRDYKAIRQMSVFMLTCRAAAFAAMGPTLPSREDEEICRA